MNDNMSTKLNVNFSLGMSEILVLGSVALLISNVSIMGYIFLALGLIGATVKIGKDVQHHEEQKREQKEKWDSIREMVHTATDVIKPAVKKSTGDSTDYH